MYHRSVHMFYCTDFTSRAFESAHFLTVPPPFARLSSRDQFQILWSIPYMLSQRGAVPTTARLSQSYWTWPRLPGRICNWSRLDWLRQPDRAHGADRSTARFTRNLRSRSIYAIPQPRSQLWTAVTGYTDTSQIKDRQSPSFMPQRPIVRRLPTAGRDSASTARCTIPPYGSEGRTASNRGRAANLEGPRAHRTPRALPRPHISRLARPDAQRIPFADTAHPIRLQY